MPSYVRKNQNSCFRRSAKEKEKVIQPNLIDNYKKVSQQIDAYTTYIDSKDASKTARKQAQFFFDKKISNNNNASSSENVQKSLKKNKTPSLFNQLINLIKKTKGDGDDTNNINGDDNNNMNTPSSCRAGLSKCCFFLVQFYVGRNM
jgi:hypothetical protein